VKSSSIIITLCRFLDEASLTIFGYAPLLALHTNDVANAYKKRGMNVTLVQTICPRRLDHFLFVSFFTKTFNTRSHRCIDTMKHLTIGIFGEQEHALLKKLGNKGTLNDLEFRNASGNDHVFTFCSPRSEKVTSLLQAIGAVDVPVVVFEEPTPQLGEAVLALDAAEFGHGVICVSPSFDRNLMDRIVGPTSLSDYTVLPLDPDAVMAHFLDDQQYASLLPKDGPVKVPIDNYFQVKSVGTVALGTVKRGELGVYTKLLLYPDGSEVLVKSIQSQDKNVKTATTLQRVGVSLKGVKPDDLKRGNVIAEKGSLTVADTIAVDISYNPFSTPPKEGDSLFVSIGLQAPVGRVEALDESMIRFSLERPVAFSPHDRAIVARTTQTPPRIVGGGTVLPVG